MKYYITKSAGSPVIVIVIAMCCLHQYICVFCLLMQGTTLSLFCCISNALWGSWSGQCLAVGHTAKSVQPVPARVEEPVSLVMQSSNGGVTNNPPFPKMPRASRGKKAANTCSFYHYVFRRRRRTPTQQLRFLRTNYNTKSTLVIQ